MFLLCLSGHFKNFLPQVIGGNRQKDTKRNVRRTKSSGQDGQFDRPSHWVNMQILDHRLI